MRTECISAPIQFEQFSSTESLGINNHGTVVGSYSISFHGLTKTDGFLYTENVGGSFRDLSLDSSTFVSDVNDKGDLVGYNINYEDFPTGFVSNGGVMTGVALLDHTAALPMSIGWDGTIIGMYPAPNRAFEYQGFLCAPRGKYIRLTVAGSTETRPARISLVRRPDGSSAAIRRQTSRYTVSSTTMWQILSHYRANPRTKR